MPDLSKNHDTLSPSIHQDHMHLHIKNLSEPHPGQSEEAIRQEIAADLSKLFSKHKCHAL